MAVPLPNIAPLLFVPPPPLFGATSPSVPENGYYFVFHIAQISKDYIGVSILYNV